ncbi:T9SS type A sorting domain-containing protein [Carboxylicivirga linearis]|uniref:T9SS type A sorting domain-containing protein n=1 Tax=Carboxylicivirga linearis TaxID=1628157 RepID=A0ABS5JV08_9BACT|nr:T9SS type A sorting domain-containing protein [Carboxylicivirga linearis]MBS2098748.1 T9SS type A sorting domain-containing protein [Carboxylicivirga linearis]
MKKLKLFILFLSITFFTYAQEKELITTAGLSSVTQEYLIDVSIGEPIIGNIVGSNYQIFNGMLFVEESLSTSDSPLKMDNILKVYPNPCNDVVLFQGIDAERVVEVCIYDLAGKMLEKSKIKNNTINVSKLLSGEYLLHIQTEKELYQTKILKK